MIRFFTQVLKFPVAAVAAGFEIVARIFRDMQQTFDRSVDAVAAGMAQSLKDTDSDADIPSGTATDVGQVVTQKGIDDSGPAVQTDGGNMEDWDGRDQDLSGDSVKVVRYRIIFTKRDYEADLMLPKEETINYPTNGGSFGALKVTEFMASVARGEVPRPDVWIQNCYPDGFDPDKDKAWNVPWEDRRYIMFLYEVVRRVEKQEKEYEKEQVKILRGIRERI